MSGWITRREGKQKKVICFGGGAAGMIVWIVLWFGAMIAMTLIVKIAALFR